MSAIEKIDDEITIAAKDYCNENWKGVTSRYSAAYHSFIAGAEWQSHQSAPEKINEQGGMRWVKASERKPTREEVENRNGETVFLLTGLGERCSGNYNELTDSWYYHEEEQYKFEVVGASLEGLEWLDESTPNELEEEVKWISVEDTMPRKEGRYLCGFQYPNYFHQFISNFRFFKKGESGEEVVDSDDITGCFFGDSGFSTEATHYQSLPKPPTKP